MKSFSNYDSEHPEIWELYKAIAFELIQSGRRKIGSKLIFEIIRWHHFVKSNEPFKVSNNYTAHYARKFVNHFPQYAGLFNFKPLRTTNISF